MAFIPTAIAQAIRRIVFRFDPELFPSTDKIVDYLEVAGQFSLTPAVPKFANGDRPDYTGDDTRYIIQNTTTGSLNIWDGTQWVEADGTPTGP